MNHLLPFDTPAKCRACAETYNAGHICMGPKGTPLERATKCLSLGLQLSHEERDAVVLALAKGAQ